MKRILSGGTSVAAPDSLDGFMLPWVGLSRSGISKGRIWRHDMKMMAENRFWVKDSKLSWQV